MSGVTLRPVLPEDLPVLFEQQRDPEACRMAAFTSRDPEDRDAFERHWRRILADDSVLERTVLLDGAIAGNLVCFEMFGQRQVGYWIGREFWGRGVATQALAQFLDLVPERPLYARAAADNGGSLRVLAKCGFTVCGRERGFAEARGEEIDEVVLVLGEPCTAAAS